jgi:hypothetical protein
LASRILRVAAVVVVALAAAALLKAPGRFPGPVRQLAEHSLNTPDPIPTAHLDVAAVRKAATIVPAGATYVVLTPASDRQLGHDLQGIAALLMLPAVPVADPARADWLLRDGERRPKALHVVHSYSLGDGIVLDRLRR